MKLSIQITPEMRIRLMHAQTIEIDVPISVSVPEGWKLVPSDADTDMMAAGVASMEEYIKDMEWDEAAMIYTAMLAAAPKPDGGAI
ncbi:hypothetical protein QPK06_05120 [Aeromonas veronii]|uniref:hypothetical protein n=1 Tax=Aeromonas veronii TaxID=654 RepID=UPI002543CC23|nr:hypothetical protein [Aeromonas veronii]WIJ42559.1 hypothetical protein QPK06_05120 [Aeromonas veronii]